MECLWLRCIDGVATPGEVDILPVTIESVKIGIVDPSKAQTWAVKASLGRVVVDDIDDHFNPGFVEFSNHEFEILDGRVLTTCISAVRGEKTN